MKTLFIIAAVFFGTQLLAQDRWTVQMNGKIVLTANQEDTAANVVTLTDLKKGSLIVTFVQQKTQHNWGRKLAVYDAADNQLYVKEAFSMVIPVKTLKKWKVGTQQLKIYTWPVSKDPRIKLKVRRVHLCTINFE